MSLVKLRFSESSVVLNYMRSPALGKNRRKPRKHTCVPSRKIKWTGSCPRMTSDKPSRLDTPRRPSRKSMSPDADMYRCPSRNTLQELWRLVRLARFEQTAAALLVKLQIPTRPAFRADARLPPCATSRPRQWICALC